MKKMFMIQMMTTLLLLFGIATEMRADEQVIVKSKSGTSVAYVLKEKPVITYEGNTLVVTVSDVRAEYPLSDVENLFFEGVATGISIANDDGMGRIEASTDGVTLSGFPAAMEVGVFRPDGRQEARYATNANGSLHIALSQKGLYLITVNRSTFKILHQ